MELFKYPTIEETKELLIRPTIESRIIQEKVFSIIKAVKTNGDRALFDFSKQFDEVSLNHLYVAEEEFDGVENRVDGKLISAINIARENIFKFHKAQEVPNTKVEIDEGITCWRKSVPIEKVGLYIPGGISDLTYHLGQ